MIPKGFCVAKAASVCGGDSREAPPFHSSGFEIVSVSSQLETKVPLWLSLRKNGRLLRGKHTPNISVLPEVSQFYTQRPEGRVT